MTVSELIQYLSVLPPDLLVLVTDEWSTRTPEPPKLGNVRDEGGLRGLRWEPLDYDWSRDDLKHEPAVWIGY